MVENQITNDLKDKKVLLSGVIKDSLIDLKINDLEEVFNMLNNNIRRFNQEKNSVIDWNILISSVCDKITEIRYSKINSIIDKL